MISERRRIGNLGEELASRFLMKRGFKILEKNYLKKWGEIDLVAEINGEIHFVEVKTSQRTLDHVTPARTTGGHVAGSRETSYSVTHVTGTYRPEENVHPQKLKRMHRAIESYLMEHEREVGDKNWQIDVITVLLDTVPKKAKIDLIENVF